MSKFRDEQISEAFGRKFVTLDQVSSEFGNMMGKILTVIDASVSSASQCKALKDIIRDCLHDAENALMQCSDDQELPSEDLAKDRLPKNSGMYGRWGKKILHMKDPEYAEMPAIPVSDSGITQA